MVATSFIPLLLAICAHANVIPRTISSTYKNATHLRVASSQSSEGLSFVFAGEDPTSSAAPSETSAALSFAFPSEDSASSGAASSETSEGISFAFPSSTSTITSTIRRTSISTGIITITPSSSSSSSSSSKSEDVLVGIDMGFTRSTNSAPLTIGIDLGPPTATSSRIGTPVGTPVGTPAAGNVSVSEQGFDFGLGGPTGAPSLVLTMIDGSFVLATVGASSTKPATTVPAGATSLKISLPVVTTAAPQEPTSPTPFEVGGITVSQNSDTQLVVGSQTLAVGSSVIVGSGSSTTAVVLETDGSSTRIVVGTATAAVPAEPTSGGSGEAAAPFEVGGITVSRNSASEIVIGTQTLGGAAGSSIVVGSGSSTTAVVLQTDASGATQVVVGGTTTAAIPTAAPVYGVEGDPDAIVFGSQTLHPGSTLTLGSGSSTTKLVLQTYPAGSSAIVVADASTTYTVAAPTRASALPTLGGAGVQLITTGLATELVVGGTQTYTFKTGGPSIGLVTEGGTTIVVAGGSGSGGTRIPIPTGLGKETSGASASASASGSSGRSSRSSLGSATGSSRTTTAAESSAAASGLSSGLGGNVGWTTASASASASASGSSEGAAARMVDGAVVGTGLVSAVCAVLALVL